MAKNKEKKERKLYVADFETTVYSEEQIKLLGEQTETEVWSAAICPVMQRPEPEDVDVYNNIYEFIDHLARLEDEAVVFFHNLKFDGSFILDELNREGFIAAMSMTNPDHYALEWEMNMTPFSYSVCISNMGQWYNIKIHFDNKTIEIRDSSKKIPSSLERMGKDFATKYRKLTMEYEGDRHKFGYISKEEMDYIKNDVLVLSEAMYIIWFEYGMQGLTIAADALQSYKTILTEPVFEDLFPDLTAVELPCDMEFYDADCNDVVVRHPNAYEYCQRGYAGGWCYQNPMARKKVFLSDEKFANMVDGDYVKVKNTIVCDVNSLYPSQMISNEFPVRVPEFRTGEPNKQEQKQYAIYRRFKCRFKIKKGYLPFIHIRNSAWYRPNECLTTTDVFGQRYVHGKDTRREFVMTDVEYKLFREHYNVYDYEAIDYLCFEKEAGIFDGYINHYKDMKIQATKEKNKAKRTIAKLFMNSLYGKLSSSTNSSYKTVYFEEDTLKFTTHIEYNKDPISISTGAWITACARNFTIRACQQNYFEGELRGFMYADTDSAHMVDMDADDVQGMKFDSSEFNCWDVEVSKCAAATYAKQKTYIEVATEESFEPVLDKAGNPSYNIIMKAAGLSDNGKNIFQQALLLNPDDKEKVYLNDFKPGLQIFNCNLKAKQIKGGVLLTKSDFKLS